MDGPAPAILNAVEDALGLPFNAIPLLPEDVFEALHGDSKEMIASAVARGES